MSVYPLLALEEQQAEVQQRYRILHSTMDLAARQTAETMSIVLGAPLVYAALNERYRHKFETTFGVEDAVSEQVSAMCAHTQLTDTAFFIDDLCNDEYFSSSAPVVGAPHIRSLAGAPLVDQNGNRFGTICVMDTVTRADRPFDLNILRSFADIISSQICLRSASRYALQDLMKLEADRSALYEQSVTDPLTGALNRRAFDDYAGKECTKSSRHNVPLAVVLGDIDFFKKVNDTFGHAAGDDVLRTVSRLIMEEIREEDVLGRLGGEEFAVLLPQTHIGGAMALTERLRQVILRSTHKTSSGRFGVTMSFGLTMVGGGETAIGPALERADKALYAAKRDGRNKVCTYLLGDQAPSSLAQAHILTRRAVAVG